MNFKHKNYRVICFINLNSKFKVNVVWLVRVKHFYLRYFTTTFKSMNPPKKFKFGLNILIWDFSTSFKLILRTRTFMMHYKIFLVSRPAAGGRGYPRGRLDVHQMLRGKTRTFKTGTFLLRQANHILSSRQHQNRTAKWELTWKFYKCVP